MVPVMRSDGAFDYKMSEVGKILKICVCDVFVFFLHKIISYFIPFFPHRAVFIPYSLYY